MRLVGFLLALLLLWSQPALAQDPNWVVGDVGGPVELRRGTTVQPLRRGLRLQPGDAVMTGRNGRVSLARGREFIVLAPLSRIVIPTAAQREGGLIQIIQELGRATFNIERRSTPHFGVRTPHLAAIVRGTVFTVRMDDVGCHVAVNEGRVEVKSADGRLTEFVDPGMEATVPAHDHSRIILDRAAADLGSSSARADTGGHSPH